MSSNCPMLHLQGEPNKNIDQYIQPSIDSLKNIKSRLQIFQMANLRYRKLHFVIRAKRARVIYR